MDTSKIIESLIFVSDSPLTPLMINEIFSKEEFQEFQMDEIKAEEVLQELMEKYKTLDLPFELQRIAGGYQFLTKPIYFDYLHYAALLKKKKKLTRTALETLAIIAYKSPVTKTEIEYIRGVNSDYAIQKLLEKQLIQIKGRSDAPGRPLLYAISTLFLNYFGINDSTDLPKLREFEMDEEDYKKKFQVYLDENTEIKQLIEEENEKGTGKEEE